MQAWLDPVCWGSNFLESYLLFTSHSGSVWFAFYGFCGRNQTQIGQAGIEEL